MRGRCCQCLLSEKLKKKLFFFYLFGISYILPTCYVSSVPLFPDTFPFFLHPVGLPLRLRLALSECHFELEKLRIVLISIWKMSTKPKRKPNKTKKRGSSVPDVISIYVISLDADEGQVSQGEKSLAYLSLPLFFFLLYFLRRKILASWNNGSATGGFVSTRAGLFLMYTLCTTTTAIYPSPSFAPPLQLLQLFPFFFSFSVTLQSFPFVTIVYRMLACNWISIAGVHQKKRTHAIQSSQSERERGKG